MSTYFFVNDFHFHHANLGFQEVPLTPQAGSELNKKIRIRLEKLLSHHCNNVQSSFSARISTLPCGGEKETQFFPPSEIIIARKTLHKFFKFRRKLGTNSAKLTMSKTKTNTKGSEKNTIDVVKLLNKFTQMVLFLFS